jgi:hypothetical protein
MGSDVHRDSYVMITASHRLTYVVGGRGTTHE